MLRNSPIISFSGSHYCIKKERRQNCSPDHKHCNLSSREAVRVTSQLPSTPTSNYPTQHCESKFLLNTLFIPHFGVQWPGHGLDNGGTGVRLPNTITELPFAKKTHFGSEIQPAPYSIVIISGKNGRGMKLANEHHPIPRLRMHGAIPPPHKRTLSVYLPFKPLKHPLFVKRKSKYL